MNTMEELYQESDHFFMAFETWQADCLDEYMPVLGKSVLEQFLSSGEYKRSFAEWLGIWERIQELPKGPSIRMRVSPFSRDYFKSKEGQ